MDWQQIQTYVIGAVVTAVLATFGKWFGDLKAKEETRKALTWAMEQAVAYAAEKWKDASKAGATKKAEALALAESLAPKAMKKLDAAQKSALVDATYARLRSSLPHPSVFSAHGDDIPVDVVGLSDRPTPPPRLRDPAPPVDKGRLPR